MTLAAKAHWGYPQRWLDLWRPALTVTPGFLATNPCFVAEDEGGTVVGWSGLVPPGPPGTDAAESGEWTLEHLWVLPVAMGRGLGRALYFRACEHARTRGGRSLLIDGDPNALPFYLRMGAAQIGEKRDTIDGRERVRPLLRAAL